MEIPAQLHSYQHSADLRIPKNRSITSINHLESIFKELELKAISLLKNELNRFRKLLTDAPCAESEERGQRGVREGALKITLHVLKNMNHTELANTLQYKLVSVAVMEKCKRITEGILQHASSVHLHEIDTELYITEGWSPEGSRHHDIRQIQAASRGPAAQEKPIKCNELFKDPSIRTALTNGVAGIGKTVSVQKFILDWAEGVANQDVTFMIPLPFRELNLMKKTNCSLLSLLHHFFPELRELDVPLCDSNKLIFIFDGLDECRLPLNFKNNKILQDVSKPAPVDLLLTNLIKGNLLPSARLWITSRPAAANQIPPEYVTQVTEIRGFSDLQKEEYFCKKIPDENLANKIIRHVKSSRSLKIMCHIPVFCWISASVLEQMLREAEDEDIPKTLTQMFTHFLIFQIKHNDQAYHGSCEPDPQKTREIVLALGKLAFQQLKKGNLIFYEEDLRDCGIDASEASVYSGLCSQIFREESGLNPGKVFSFIHLSVQEFLAALFAFINFSNGNPTRQQTTDLPGLFKKPKVSEFLKGAVDKALQSKTGHLDLFLRFLLGLSVESNQNILGDLLPQTGSSSQCREEIVKYVKKRINENPAPEKFINLFHCLNELNDESLVQEVQMYLNKGGYNCLSGTRLSPSQWAALVFVLLNSDQELNAFVLNKYHASERCLLKLLQVVKASRKVVLWSCNLTEKGCSVLSSVLSSKSCNVRNLDLSSNDLLDSGVKLLSAGLQSPQCVLEILQLSKCGITEEGCAALVSALRSNPSSHLRELNLSYNHPGEAGVRLLADLLKHPHCNLEKLELYVCGLTEKSCSALTSALASGSCCLRELDVSNNRLQNSGVKFLSAGLDSPLCNLETLGLELCEITQQGCAHLVSALISNPASHLKDLNLCDNKPGDSGVKVLCDLLQHPHCTLEKLELTNCLITEEGCAALASALRSNPSSQLRELKLNSNKPGESGRKLLSDLLQDPQCNLKILDIQPSRF